MATFSHLATELVELIASYLAQQDLYTLSRVNKSLSKLVVPYLYRDIDLAIQTGEKIPRIDKFCFNILEDTRRAARVERLRLGPSSEDGVKDGQRWLPNDKHFDDSKLYQMAMTVLDEEPIINGGDYLRDAISQREYAAYATLIILTLPRLLHLDVADFAYSTMDRLQTVLRNLDAKKSWNQRQPSPALLDRLACIKAASCNVDRTSGLPYPDEKGRICLDQIFNLPGLETLEFSITNTQAELSRTLNPGGLVHWPSRLLVSRVRTTNITRLLVRHSTSCALAVRQLLACTPQLTSFTWDIAYDCRNQQEAPERWIDLDAWTTSLSVSKSTLQVLAFAVEYFDSGKYAFEQPEIGSRQFGFLDLTGFEHLHTLEVPISFLTGDVEFSITAEIYALLPPYLRHLSLRLDLTHAQLSYQLDTSILSQDLTLSQSRREATYAMNARMDLSYIYHATLALIDQAPAIESIAVWQPADPAISWFEGQISDFATTCSNRSIVGALLFPMLLRWKKPEHRDLVKEDSLGPSHAERSERLCRSERTGIPLGLASHHGKPIPEQVERVRPRAAALPHIASRSDGRLAVTANRTSDAAEDASPTISWPEVSLSNAKEGDNKLSEQLEAF
ncbi:hypothetical protein OPT61_g6939 [Boeremia exigua]|uniref:Uncharacterized protein n=1 Tax=Boeremia exigua TaxID=749465 RepID=A0ACC2I476_9PLEO|nr:hypothetical protein OPT61_g6939 [Boeremia exigua]